VVKVGAIIEWLDDISAFRSLVRLSDELGYDVIGVGDTPARAYEMYVSLTVAEQESRNAILAPIVTAPFLRHPVITATAISTLYELAGGRVMLAIGSGGSAGHVLGRRYGATHQELRDYVIAVQQILAGSSSTVDGRTTERLGRVHALPVFVAADFPESLRLAGEIADGVITTVGMSLEHVEEKIAMVRTSAEKAGRDPGAIEIWGFSYVSVRDSLAEAKAEIGTALASDVSVRMKAPYMRAKIPAELLDAVKEMERQFEFQDHEFLDRTVRGKLARLLEGLGLVDFAVGLSGVTGDVAEVADYLKRLESAGVSCLFAALPVLSDPAGTLRGLSQAAGRARGE
jgi:5,10-methylenetetrahydromethanopterin reductase